MPKPEPLRRRAAGEPAPWDADHAAWQIRQAGLAEDLRGRPTGKAGPSLRKRAAREYALVQRGEFSVADVEEGAPCSYFLTQQTLMDLIAEGRMVRRRDPADRAGKYLYRVRR